MVSSLKGKSLSGLFWDFTGRISLQGIGFIVSIFLARILAPEDFGLLAIIMVFINLAMVFLDFGFSTALVQRAEISDAHYSSVFYLNVSIGFLLSIFVFISAPYIAAFYDKPVLTNLIRLMSLGFIIGSFGNVLRAKLRREMNFKVISFVNVFAGLISGIVALYMAWTGYGVWSLAAQSVVNLFIANLLLNLISPLRFSLKLSFQPLKDLWIFGSRMFFTGLIDTIFLNADSLIIGKVLNASTLGFYYRAKSLEAFSMRYTASTIESVLLPGLSSIQNNVERLKRSVTKIFHLLSLISFLGCGILFVTSNELILILFSEKWKDSIIFFQIIIFGSFTSQIFNLFYNTLLSTGKIDIYLRINITHKIFLFINLFTLLHFGIEIYLVCFTIIRLLIFIICIASVIKTLDFGFSFYKQTGIYFISYSITICLTLWLKWVVPFSSNYTIFFFCSFSFVVIFPTFLFLMRSPGLKLFYFEVIAPLRTRIAESLS